MREGRDDLGNALAMTLMNLNEGLQKQGRLEEAIVEIQAARKIWEGLVRAGQLHLSANLATCWNDALLAAKQIGEQEAIIVVHSACSLLDEMLPHRAKLPVSSFGKIADFLRLAQESNLCADEAAGLAVQFAPQDLPAGRAV